MEVIRFIEHGKVCWGRGHFKRKPERLSSDRLHIKSRFPVLFGGPYASSGYLQGEDSLESVNMIDHWHKIQICQDAT